MSVIIKRGVKKHDVATYDCKSCDSTIRFTRADIQSDQRDGDYVMCPVCEKFIDVRVLAWTFQPSVTM